MFRDHTTRNEPQLYPGHASGLTEHLACGYNLDTFLANLLLKGFWTGTHRTPSTSRSPLLLRTSGKIEGDLAGGPKPPHPNQKKHPHHASANQRSSYIAP